MYSDEDQERLLSFLDGVYSGNKLFVATANDTYKVNQHYVQPSGPDFLQDHFRGYLKKKSLLLPGRFG